MKPSPLKKIKLNNKTLYAYNINHKQHKATASEILILTAQISTITKK